MGAEPAGSDHAAESVAVCGNQPAGRNADAGGAGEAVFRPPAESRARSHRLSVEKHGAVVRDPVGGCSKGGRVVFGTQKRRDGAFDQTGFGGNGRK